MWKRWLSPLAWDSPGVRINKFHVGGNHLNGDPHFKGDDVKWSPKKAAEYGDTIVIEPGQSMHDIIEQDCERGFQKRSITY